VLPPGSDAAVALEVIGRNPLGEGARGFFKPPWRAMDKACKTRHGSAAKARGKRWI
jgi:hypothetical protein